MNALQLGALKTLVHTIGRLSDGVRIACEHGLTSGKMIDYVYRNQPSGKLLVGRLLDRIYLSHEAWEAVRVRKRNLAELLEWAIRRQLADSGEVLLLDIAAAQARYVQDALAKFPQQKVEAVCWDLDKRWLREGRARAAERGLRNIHYKRGDALDARCYDRLGRRPNVVVASGFYDWMENDDTIKRSLEIVRGALDEGGWFLFTIQTGHANLQMVNEVFSGFDGEALRMSTRPRAVVHRWARQAGFEITRSKADRWGYYAVTLARKR